MTIEHKLLRYNKLFLLVFISDKRYKFDTYFFNQEGFEPAFDPFNMISADRTTKSQSYLQTIETPFTINNDLNILQHNRSRPILVVKKEEDLHLKESIIPSQIANSETKNSSGVKRDLKSNSSDSRNNELISFTNPFLLSDSNDSEKKRNSDLDLLGDPFP
jgi:hypothetical protein